MGLQRVRHDWMTFTLPIRQGLYLVSSVLRDQYNAWSRKSALTSYSWNSVRLSPWSSSLSRLTDFEQSHIISMSMIPQTVSKVQASFPNSRLIHPATYFPSPLGYLLDSLVQKGTHHSFFILTVPPAGSHRHWWQLHLSRVSESNPGITLDSSVSLSLHVWCVRILLALKIHS